jgi:hypothetical protein
MLKATCLCNSVRFEIHETPSEPTACHCTQCRKQTGHFLASANVQKAAIKPRWPPKLPHLWPPQTPPPELIGDRG